MTDRATRIERAVYRLFVNEQRTILVTLWPNGEMDVAFRETPSHVWGPPTRLTEEKPL